MNNELLNAFDRLDINNKRNKLSDELMTIGELINGIENSYNIPTNLNVKNYDQVNDASLTESEMLNFIYDDVLNIEKEILSLCTIILNKVDENE